MSIDAQVKKINALTEQLEEVADQNTIVLEGEQQFQTELGQFLREKDEHIRNLNGEFALEIQRLKQESAKATTEYHQDLNKYREEWSSNLAFAEKVIPLAPEASNPSTNHE